MTTTHAYNGMTLAILGTSPNQTLQITGATYMLRDAIKAEGFLWFDEESPKHWAAPYSDERFYAALAIIQRGYVSTGEGEKRGRGRPRKYMPGEQAPKAQQEAPKAQQEGVPQGDDAKVRQLRDLLRELSGGKAELDEGRVRDLVEEQTDWVSHKLDELERRIEERPVTRLEIKQGDDVRVVEGVHHPELARLIRYLSVGVNVWLSGPSGSGKTHSAEQAASALGLSFALHGAMTMAHELVGFVDAAGHYHTTPFVRAFRDGGLVLLDELDAGSNEALLCLNGALANGIMCLANGEIIRRHKDFRCIGAANTMGTGATHEYVGRTRIDAAFLQRFGAAIVWDYDETLETAISGNPDWSAYVQKARAKAKELGFKILVTPRASIDGARLIATGDTFREAAIMTFGRGLTADQRTQMGI